MLTDLYTVLIMLYTSLVDNEVDMNKPPISFRLTDKEWEVLEREQQSNESINQTAARLLREKLGIQNVDNEYTLETNTLRNWITDEVNLKSRGLQFAFESLAEDEIRKVYERLGPLETRLDFQIEQILQRLSEVEAKLVAKPARKPRSPKAAKNDSES